MKLTNNFKLEELIYSSTAEANNINNYPSESEIYRLKQLCENILQPIRDKWKNSILVTSGYRNPILNRLVKGSPTSQHVKGEAADITVGSKEDNKKLFNIIVDMIENNEITVGQLIDERNYSWIHISLPYKNKNQILHL